MTGETVPEVVDRLKCDIAAKGADEEIVAGFFADMDAVAALHVN